MKIIVKNEKEKELVKKFWNCIYELDIFEDIERIDNESSADEESYLNGYEYLLLRDNLPFCKVEIDPSEEEMWFENSDIITGTCKACGTFTEGLIDGGGVPYSDFLMYQSEESQDSWICLTCAEKKNKEDL